MEHHTIEEVRLIVNKQNIFEDHILIGHGKNNDSSFSIKWEALFQVITVKTDIFC